MIGAVDGSHIPVGRVPSAHQDEYINRKMQHSVNLIAVCDAKKKFTYVNVGFPGTAHDARVFQLSGVARDIEVNVNSVFFFS